MARNCLIVSYYFPPTGGAGVQRIVKLIKYASRKAWRFTVITAEESSNFQPRDSSLLSEIPQGTKIIRAEAILPAQKFRLVKNTNLFNKSAYWKRWLGAFVHIPDSRKSWNIEVKKSIDREMRKNDYDCILITSPPYSLTILAFELQQNLSIPVILDMRDPWSTHPYKLHPTFFHKWLNKKLEHKIMTSIKRGIHVCKRQLDDYAISIQGFNRNNWAVITNGYDKEDFIGIKGSKDVNGIDFNIAFLGTIHADINSPEYLFRAIKYLKRQGKKSDKIIRFHHIGHSAVSIKRLAEKYGIEEQVTLWGYRPHNEALEILTSMNAFFQIHHPRYKDSKYIIGGKMYEYLYLKKPILAVVPQESEVADIIKDTDCGEIVSSVKTQDIAAALLKIKNGQNYKFHNTERYERKSLADRFISVFMEACTENVRQTAMRSDKKHPIV